MANIVRSEASSASRGRLDRFGGAHSVADDKAIEAFGDAVEQVAAHRPAAGAAIKTALELCPDFIAAHALSGFAALILARQECIEPARQAFSKAKTALANQHGTPTEKTLVAGLGLAVEGQFLACADLLERHLAHSPHELLFAKLAQALRFMAGDQAGMLAFTSRLVPQWSSNVPGYGFLLGCHAFALEEAGDYASAERAGLTAIAHEPSDVWGLHAVAHVHEMRGQTATGRMLLETTRPMWKQANNFAFHMAWHLCLFHVEHGQHDLALSLYDEDVRPGSTEDFRDIANAVSLLWRLRQEGVDVGKRWDELEVVASRRVSDTTLVFAALHHLLTLVATGNFAHARQLVDNLGAKGAGQTGDQGHAAKQAGHALGQAILVAGQGRFPAANLVRLAETLPVIGGSHAQRDVFMRTLAMMAAEQGNQPTTHDIMTLRQHLRRDDRFSRLVAGRLAFSRTASAHKLAS